MVHTLVISVLGMQIKVNLWGSLDRQANPLQEFLALERPSIQKSWMVPEKIPKVFFCPPYGGHMPPYGGHTLTQWKEGRIYKDNVAEMWK